MLSVLSTPHMNRLSALRSALATSVLASMMLPSVAFAQNFTDIPKDSPVLAAAEYLQSKGIVQAAAKFNPNDKLNRAQAAKILVVPLVSAEELAKVTSSQFSDVPAGQWYLPYAEAARSLGIVDSAAKFNPSAPLTKSAFIKMLLSSKEIDYVGAFSDVKLPLSSDVSSTSDWFYPVMRFALASSMTAANAEGLLSPGQELTRGDMALLYHRLDMYLEGRRTQALLSQTETDIGNVLQLLDAQVIDQAEWASARSIMTARGALAVKPEEPVVKGAMKIAEGFQSLLMAYKAGVEGRLDDVIAQAKAAYGSAEKAKSFSSTLASIADQMQTIAKSMADEARTLQATPK